MSRRGQALFAARLARFADNLDEPQVAAIARGAAAAVTAAVRGRGGVGGTTVARALTAAGVEVGRDGDVDVHGLAEAVKPEDHAAIKASARPTLVVLNKADLVAEPLALCARYRAITGLPTVPMAAHLAIARLDDDMMSALRALAAEHAELGSVDDVAKGPYRPLLETLDLAGIAHAVRAVGAGAEPTSVQRVLRRLSGVDGVVAALAPMLAEAGYRRVRSAVAALEVTAATAASDVAARVAEFLKDDDTVLALMAAAVDVVEAAGMTVDPGDDAAAHLCRALHWDRCRRAPLNSLHRACGDDIVRGSLRLWRLAQAGRTTR